MYNVANVNAIAEQEKKKKKETWTDDKGKMNNPKKVRTHKFLVSFVLRTFEVSYIHTQNTHSWIYCVQQIKEPKF